MMAFSWHGESPNTSVLNVCASLHRQSRSETSTRQQPARSSHFPVFASGETKPPLLATSSVRMNSVVKSGAQASLETADAGSQHGRFRNVGA